MSFEKDLQDAFKKLKERGISTFSAEVVDVDKDNGTCTVNDGEIEYTDVRLASVVNGRKDVFYVFPKLNSSVLVSPINEDLAALYVETYSDVEQVFLNIETTTVRFDKDGVVIQKGSENLGEVLQDTFKEITKTFTQNGMVYNIPAFELLKERLNTILIDL